MKLYLLAFAFFIPGVILGMHEQPRVIIKKVEVERKSCPKMPAPPKVAELSCPKPVVCEETAAREVKHPQREAASVHHDEAPEPAVKKVVAMHRAVIRKKPAAAIAEAPVTPAVSSLPPPTIEVKSVESSAAPKTHSLEPPSIKSISTKD